MIRYDCSAVILDLDGVLVDSTALVERQWREWAAARGLEAEPFLRVCHGRRALETIRLAAPELDAEAEVASLMANHQPADNEVRALPGAERLLSQLPDSAWAVATSGSRAAAVARLTAAGLPTPGIMVCAEDVVQGKPHPEVYLTAAARLDVAPADCLVIEDAPAGIEAARAGGIRVVALATTHEAATLPVEVCAVSLADIHLGRIGPAEWGRQRLELLVIEIVRDRVPASFEQRRAPRASFGREPRG